MTRAADPLSGVPDSNRYATSQNRYADEPIFHRGPAGTYLHLGVTLEEEAKFDGWLPNERPTMAPDGYGGNTASYAERRTDSNGLNRLYTTGLRGEPGWDDDPSVDPDGRYDHGSLHANAERAGDD